VRAAYRDLGDQCSRAVTNVGLNAAEGLGRAGKDRGYHFRIAYGSALEATATLQMLSAVGGVPAGVAEEALAVLDRTRAMLWRLMQPRP
jgi:four helix bundle protein